MVDRLFERRQVFRRALQLQVQDADKDVALNLMQAQSLSLGRREC